MSPVRRCSRTACARAAVATLTYVYSDQTAVLGPLATYAEPHAYDLCLEHSQRLSAPRGWEVLRLSQDQAPAPSQDDLLALADAVREAARPLPPTRTPHRSGGQVEPEHAPVATATRREGARRGHLRVLTNTDQTFDVFDD